ncbi:MAG: type II toxin-antitoxin system RelE/ParE family toxin [Gammaproteobacteria bacterium]
MIENFKHRGLQRYFTRGTKSGIPTELEPRIRLILGRLNASEKPQDMGLPGLYLHELKGRRKGTWSVRISGNRRITFKFNGVNAAEVDLDDYH